VYRQRFFLIVVSAFLVGVMVSVAYMITAGVINPLNNLVAMKNSWATEETVELKVSPDTVVNKQSIYLCGDVETEKEPDAKALMGMSYAELLKMFDAKDGWQVQFLTSEELILARSVNDLCPKHKAYRHLSIHQNKLAVFEGPLGVDTQLIEVVGDKNLQELPQSLQSKLQQASEYYKQNQETQAELQKELEFSSEKQLNAALENIDELD
jgi:hypothetical protein